MRDLYEALQYELQIRIQEKISIVESLIKKDDV